MIQLNKKILTFYFVLFFPTFVLAQNLFDEPNVLKFANFLYATHQYKFASEEYERLVNLVPNNMDYKISLVRSYRLGENYKFAGNRLVDFSGDSLNFLAGPLATEYLKIKLLQDSCNEAQRYLNVNQRFETTTKLKYQEFIFLLSMNWSKADSFNQKYHPLLQESQF